MDKIQFHRVNRPMAEGDYPNPIHVRNFRYDTFVLECGICFAMPYTFSDHTSSLS